MNALFVKMSKVGDVLLLENYSSHLSWFTFALFIPGLMTLGSGAELFIYESSTARVRS